MTEIFCGKDKKTKSYSKDKRRQINCKLLLSICCLNFRPNNKYAKECAINLIFFINEFYEKIEIEKVRKKLKDFSKALSSSSSFIERDLK